MNKRILELWEQSADKFPHGIKTNPERFAELIIRECAKVADESQFKFRQFPVSIAIEEHFDLPK
jgi:hypothetical protein